MAAFKMLGNLGGRYSSRHSAAFIEQEHWLYAEAKLGLPGYKPLQ
jgi:hypothetical protein